MKKLYLSLLFFILFFHSFGQEKKIESLRKDFTLLNLQNRAILNKYDSLINKRDALKAFLENEIEIYQSCERAYLDKLIFIEKKGDRQQKSLLDEFNMLQLEYDGLESKVILNIRDFNYWNDITAAEIKKRYQSWMTPEMQKMKTSYKELNNYVKRIDELQSEASKFLISYDSCRLQCLVNCDCEGFMIEYRQRIRLAETYMKRYNQLLREDETHYTLRKGKYNEYRDYYDRYFDEYQDRKEALDVNNQLIRKQQANIRTRLKQLESEVNSMIKNEMEQDIKLYLNSDIQLLSKLEKEIIDGLGNQELYYDFKELQKRSQIIIMTLNPEMDVKEVSDRIFPEKADEKIYELSDNDGDRLKYISSRYLNILNEFKTVIAAYDNIPYFCLNAYPNYSDPIVDENLKIIENRIRFSSKNLESKTEEFLNIEELDLSNTNFSLDLLFKGHRNLQKLNLSNTKISSIKYLAGTNIQWLDLSNTDLDRQDLEDLKSLNDIEYLNLANTGIRKKDIYDLCYFLKVRRKNCIAQ